MNAERPWYRPSIGLPGLGCLSIRDGGQRWPFRPENTQGLTRLESIYPRRRTHDAEVPALRNVLCVGQRQVDKTRTRQVNVVAQGGAGLSRPSCLLGSPSKRTEDKDNGKLTMLFCRANLVYQVCMALHYVHVCMCMCIWPAGPISAFRA